MRGLDIAVFPVRADALKLLRPVMPKRAVRSCQRREKRAFVHTQRYAPLFPSEVLPVRQPARGDLVESAVGAIKRTAVVGPS
jgi:hypothetical protein